MELAVDGHIMFGQGIKGRLPGGPRCGTDAHKFLLGRAGQHAIGVIEPFQGILLGLPLIILGHRRNLVEIVPGLDITWLQSHGVILLLVKQTVLIVLVDLLLQFSELMIPQLVPGHGFPLGVPEFSVGVEIHLSLLGLVVDLLAQNKY